MRREPLPFREPLRLARARCGGGTLLSPKEPSEEAGSRGTAFCKAFLRHVDLDQFDADGVSVDFHDLS